LHYQLWLARRGNSFAILHRSIIHKKFVRRQRSTQEYAKLTYAQTDQAANLTFKNE
jgi:hypothetical protein